MIFLQEDREICKALLEKARERGDSARSVGDLIVEVGLHFLGAPYETGTLEKKGPEGLVVNLRAFDCVTFVENAVILAGMIWAGKTAFGDYAAALERIRYRGGRRNGYPSRLHYFTDWLRDNGRKGVIREITRDLGGIPFRKAFHELTDHREDRPPLRGAAAFRRMRIVEAACSRRTLHCVPKADLPGIEKRIENGDIIAVTTNADGIDVSHTGIAVRGPRGLHLLHASSAAGKVVLSDETLYRYLISRRALTGIIVGRAIPADANACVRSKRLAF
ncbi:MAG: N-acetylmuramoyl-L-alanine amidase-like domain-containing protein [Pseudomonadota bacterium]